jgi:hypothetical protein
MRGNNLQIWVGQKNEFKNTAKASQPLFLKSGAGICESYKFHEFRLQMRQAKYRVFCQKSNLYYGPIIGVRSAVLTVYLPQK